MVATVGDGKKKKSKGNNNHNHIHKGAKHRCDARPKAPLMVVSSQDFVICTVTAD